MKILFIANRFPYPPFRGDKLKIYNLAKQLSLKHEIHLITFVEDPSDYQHLDKLNGLFSEIILIDLPKWKSYWHVLFGFLNKNPLQVNYFKSKNFAKQLKQLLSQHTYDAIHVQHLRMAQYAIDLVHPNKILDLPDAFSLYWQRRKAIKRNYFVRVLDQIESKKVMLYEKFILGKFTKNLVCSSEDAQFLREKHGSDNVMILPNGVDVHTFKPMHHDYSHHHTLLFTGNMDYAPNVDAVIYFAEQILPLVLEKFEVQFIIAGQRPIESVKALHNGKTIVVTGFIDDLTQTYNNASVVVAPLRFGAGTQNKVLEAMAMGIPVVCSNIGFEGLGIQDGEGAFMRKDTTAFAEQVIALLSSSDLRKATGEKGVEVIQSRFSWESIAQTLEAYFRG
ncbi:MAG: glycosyltransferase [Bacteroidota bacterium]|nr:glycosyltransferase [Bacteroidota bacterium]